jgi:DNA polymerase (family 10)
MPVHNAEIAGQFNRLADLLELEDANPFRVRAYRTAARTINGLSHSLADLLAAGEDLSKLPGIGKDLAGKIRTLIETGKLPLLEQVQARTPAALSDLMRIDGLGPKRVKVLHRELDINSFEDLQRAARSGRIRELAGFGEKTEARILERLEASRQTEIRTRLVEAEDIAGPLIRYLQGCPGVKQVAIAGSYRRRRETVGDLDILVTAKQGTPVADHFVAYDEVSEVVSQGKARSTVRLRSGLQVDLRVVPGVSYGAALLYFTGSKAHNIALRKLAIKRGYKLNEYGLYKGDERVAGATETAVYKKLGLPSIEPELREQRGEIEAARKGRLPKLVSRDDIRGDLHCHTRATDGRDSLEAMVTAARKLGYEYLAITDHSRHLTVAHGLDRKRLLEQIRRIDKLNAQQDDIVVLRSIEVDILEDGRLDLPDSVLGRLDLVVGAVHYKFNLGRKQQTERIIRAMDNPHFNILAHPGGRLLNRRPPLDVDMERLMQAASERGCFLELNAQPARLDLTDSDCLLARDLHVKVALSTDAHSTDQLDYMRFAVGQARRGWLEAGDVLNTRGLGELRKLLRRK